MASLVLMVAVVMVVPALSTYISASELLLPPTDHCCCFAVGVSLADALQNHLVRGEDHAKLTNVRLNLTKQ
jgi:hypothetical protein